MQTDIVCCEGDHLLGESAIRTLSGGRSPPAELLLMKLLSEGLSRQKTAAKSLLILAMPRHGSSSRTRKGYAGFVRAEALRLRYLADQLLHPALGRVQLRFQG
jgi:hypothetical protein